MTSTAGRDQQRQSLEHFLLVENCLVAELHRLRSIAPAEFFIQEGSKEKIARLVVDFAYFEKPKIVDELIEKDEVAFCYAWPMDFVGIACTRWPIHTEIAVVCQPIPQITRRILQSYEWFCWVILSMFRDHSTLLVTLTSSKALKMSWICVFPKSIHFVAMPCSYWVLFYCCWIPNFRVYQKSEYLLHMHEWSKSLYICHHDYLFSGELQSKNFELIMSILRHRRENYESCLSNLGLNREFIANSINFLRCYTFSHVH